MVGILVDPIDLEKKKSNPYSSMVPLKEVVPSQGVCVCVFVYVCVCVFVCEGAGS